MKFFTPVEIPAYNLKIDEKHILYFMGSCFAENVGKKFTQNKIKTIVNPFGVIYNSSAIRSQIERIVSNIYFTEQDCFFTDGLWRTTEAHTLLYHQNLNDFLDILNKKLHLTRNLIKESHAFIITLGTSWVYQSVETKKIVANCHKLPSHYFNRYRQSVEQVFEDLKTIESHVKKINPNIQFIATVSPVRHLKDGCHENQLNKSTLLLAIDQWQKSTNCVHYFPAYELVMDELRDYRYYAEDLFHINEQTVDFIWEKFCSSFLTKTALIFIKETSRLKQSLEHRPLNTYSKSYITFIKHCTDLLTVLETNYPFCDFSEEHEKINYLNNLSNNQQL